MGIVIEEIRTPAFSMKYFRFGTGSKTFVILPGLSVQSVMNSADAIAKQYEDMKEDLTVYVLDRRERIPDSYTVREMAEDTAEAFLALGLKDVYLFGASQGGMMAMVIAAEHPELVRGLILGSTSASVREKQYEAVGKWIRLAKEGDGERLYLAFGEALYPQTVFAMYKEILKAAGKTVTGDEFRRFVIMAEGTRGFDARADLAEVTCPILVLGDSKDAVLGPQAADEICEVLKSGKAPFACHIYEGFGHAAFDTAPDYRKRILAFIQGPHFQEQHSCGMINTASGDTAL